MRVECKNLALVHAITCEPAFQEGEPQLPFVKHAAAKAQADSCLSQFPLRHIRMFRHARTGTPATNLPIYKAHVS